MNALLIFLYLLIGASLGVAFLLLTKNLADEEEKTLAYTLALFTAFIVIVTYWPLLLLTFFVWHASGLLPSNSKRD